MRINESGGRRYLQVVESCRNEAGKPRHRVSANLGRIDGMADDHLDALIRKTLPDRSGRVASGERQGRAAPCHSSSAPAVAK